MAKGSVNGTSPAVNWFFNDWQGGTMIFSRLQKGCYMDLLTAQFNHGHLSLDAIRTVLNGDFEKQWSTLQGKFLKDEAGLFFNKRLEDEINKRKKYSKSQSERRSGKSPDNPGEYGNGNGIGLEEGKEPKGGAGDFYRSFNHLSISKAEVSHLLDKGFTLEQVDDILDRIENYVGNTKYKSLHLTAQAWLKKDKTENPLKYGTSKKHQPSSPSNGKFGDL